MTGSWSAMLDAEQLQLRAIAPAAPLMYSTDVSGHAPTRPYGRREQLRQQYLEAAGERLQRGDVALAREFCVDAAQLRDGLLTPAEERAVMDAHAQLQRGRKLEANATCNQCGYRGTRHGKHKWCPACYDGDGEPGELILDAESTGRRRL